MKQTITIQNKEYTVEPYGKFHFRCFHNGNTTVGTIEEIKEVIIQGLNNILIQKLT